MWQVDFWAIGMSLWFGPSTHGLPQVGCTDNGDTC